MKTATGAPHPLSAFRLQSSLPRCIRRCGLALLLIAARPLAAHAQDLRSAETDLLQGRADHATTTLHALLLRDPHSGPAHLLLCRTLLSELHGDDAAAECQLALANGLAQNSSAQDWAGRAFGMKAEHAGPVTGLRLAGAVRSAFLSAHTLDPRSVAAINDLGEYYVGAPFIVGGGLAKAYTLADAVQGTSPQTAHRLRALAAEKDGDNAAAQREFEMATQVAQSPGAWVDLANFFIRHGEVEKAIAAARKALALDTRIDDNVLDAAVALADAHQPAPAITALRSYIDRGTHSDAAPLFRAHTVLADLLLRTGDRAGARREYQEALALASQYAPARKGLAAL